MAFELRPGDVCRVSKPLIIDGTLAFERGEDVEILAVDPDPERPGYKYMVGCPALDGYVRMRGSDLDRKFCQECGESLIQSAYECSNCGWVVPGREAERREADLAEFRNRKYEKAKPGAVPKMWWL